MAEEALSEVNQDALDDLLVAIEASGRRLGIFIAVCDDPQLKAEIISRYEQALAPEFRPYRLALDADEPSLKALLSAQMQADEYLQQGGQAVMTILGAEGLRSLRFEAEKSQQETFFGYLQWTREGLQDFPFAIVLWVTYQLQEQLSRKAPDFWSWRRDVVRFVSPKRQAIEMDALPSLREQAQFSQLEAVGNTLPIDDLESLIEQTATKSPGSALLASLHLQAGRAYGQRLDVGAAQEYTEEMKQAIAHLQTAAQLLESSGNSSDYASSIAWLAYLYKLQGRYAEAEPLYLQDLEITKSELGDRHPATATSLNNLAALYESQGRYGEAEPLYVEALEIKKAELGDRHPTTAQGLNNLAELYRSQGRYGEAEPLYVEALEIRKAELGDRHPTTASSLNNLALLYKSQGRYGEAEPLYVEALEIKKAELGDRHPDTASSLNNLALLYYSTNRLPEAAATMSEVVGILEDLLGPNHPNTLTVKSNLEAIQQAIKPSTEPDGIFIVA